jgi:hypothetical protein
MHLRPSLVEISFVEHRNQNNRLTIRYLAVGSGTIWGVIWKWACDEGIE